MAAIIRAIATDEISGKIKSIFFNFSFKIVLVIIPSPTGITITFTIDINIDMKETSTIEPAIKYTKRGVKIGASKVDATVNSTE